ncbi:MAG: site-specific DNA-methyltransferase, partial [Bacteroidales bacterium]|nr:site-specific DNA-methyltransferase [Bacteroidales bacterium]
IHGDNLEALKSLLPEYEGKIKCIYIDPPYNTGNENWVYNDNVNHPKIRKWLESTLRAKENGKEAAIGIDDLARHDKWLCMMYPRLQLLHKLLDKDGAIFVSLDEIETSHLRLILNEIFGASNFVAQLTLLCNPKGRSQDKYFSTNHEYITVYSKSIKEKDSFSVMKDDGLIAREYKLQDRLGRYRILELRNTHREFSRLNRPNLFYPLFVDPVSQCVFLQQTNPDFIEVYPLWPDGFEGCWTWGKELAEKDNTLLLAQKTRGKWKIYRKSYSTSEEGENVKKKLFTIWNDAKFYTEKGQATFGEIFPGLNKNDFPQPKSVDLISEVLKTCTSDNEIILDSFAGSGTTAHAVLNLNKVDGGNRKFILVEMEDYADSITAERVKRVIKGYSDKEGTGGSFDYYVLGKPLFIGENSEFLNEEVGTDKIREYIWFSETRTSYDLRCTIDDLKEYDVRSTIYDVRLKNDDLDNRKSKIVNLQSDRKSKIVNQKSDNQYFLGKKDGTAYYFIYEKEILTTLDYDLLSTINSKAGQYVIYADNCLLAKDFMMKHNIIFKKIPRDITRF